MALNDLTMLFNSPTVSGCNEMDSERALLKKFLGDEFVVNNLLTDGVRSLKIEGKADRTAKGW